MKLPPVDLGIAIPTLNAAATLPGTLESLLPLRDAGARVIVVDSYSTDATQDLARSRGFEVMEVPKGNMYVAVNAGLRAMDNAWLTYINGDDVLYADAVAQALNTVPDSASVIYGRLDYIDGAGRFLHHWKSPRPAALPWLFPREMNPVPQQGTLWRRDVFEALDGFDDARYKQSGDCDFFYRALLKGYGFYRLDNPPIAGFRIHGAQFTQTARGEQSGDAVDSTRRLRDREPGLRSHLEFWWNRLRNWDSYLGRCYRSHALLGRYGHRGSVQPLPAAHERPTAAG